MKKVTPEVAESLRAITGCPRRTEDVVKNFDIDRISFLNHIRSARASGIPVEHIGPMSHRYFYLPAEYRYNIKETVAASIKKIMANAREEDDITVEYLAQVLEVTTNHVRSVFYAWKKKGQVIYSTPTGVGKQKKYWTVPTEPVEREHLDSRSSQALRLTSDE